MLFATPMNHGILMVGFTKTNFNFWNILVMHKLYRCIIKREWVNEKVSIVDVLHLFANFTLSLYQHNFLFCDSRKRIFYNVNVVHYLMLIWMKMNLVSLANFSSSPRHNWNMYCKWRRETFWPLQKPGKCLGLVESSVRSTICTLAEM